MKKISLILIIISCLHSCQPSPDVSIEKEGQQYGVTSVPFKGQWWHYYERGLSFADGCFWKEAESDLREAVRKRDDDKKYARTYGRHFLDLPEKDPGYFPHRELGIMLYHQEQIEEAITELTISLESETSSRAQLYLDRARKSLIQQKQLDRQPPEINFESPSQGFLTNASDIVVLGKVSDDTFVRHILVGGKSVQINVSAQEIQFRMKIGLKHNENRIPVTATDLTGREKTEYILVNVDRIGPVISIDNPVEDINIPGSQALFKGYAFDNSGIAEMIINGIKRECKGEKEISIEQPVPLQSGKNILEIEVKDMAGNITSAKIPFTKNRGQADRADHADWLAQYGDNSLARAVLKKNSRAHEKDYLPGLSGTVNTNESQSRNLLFASAQADMKGPKISLTRFKDEKKQYTVYLDEILIEGNIKDDTKVKHLWVNREEIVLRGKRNYFTYIHTLEKGINFIVIRGINSSGKEARKTIRIEHKVPLVQDYESRLSVEIKEFEERPEKLDLSFDLQEALDSIMFERKRFQVVTEDEISEGHGSDCALNGNIRKRLNYVEVRANFYQYSTDPKAGKERLAKVDVYREHESTKQELIVDRDLIKEMARELHLKLSHEIPLLEGTVMETDGKVKIATDLGEETKVKKGMSLIVFEKNTTAPDQDFTNLGKAVIDTIKNEKSYADIKEGGTQIISKGNHVITR